MSTIDILTDLIARDVNFEIRRPGSYTELGRIEINLGAGKPATNTRVVLVCYDATFEATLKQAYDMLMSTLEPTL